MADNDPWIYHHKWLFVADDYPGFDVEAAKNRSRQWLALDGIDFRRIGKKSFWETNVVPRLSSQIDRNKKTSNEEPDLRLRSDEVMKLLHVTACELSHLRIDGEIGFRKAGNSYLYSAADCERISSSGE